MAVTEQEAGTGASAPAAPAREVVYRHTVVVRLTHWLNALFLTLLLMSGLEIFNAHPALYWGHYGYPGVPTVLLITGRYDPEQERPIGEMRIGDYSIETTGVLGVTFNAEGQPLRSAVPEWARFGSHLGLARDWHFLMAWLFVINGAIYLLFGLFSGHFRRDLAPSADQLRPRHILNEVWDHIRLRRPRGDAAKRYNVLQKLAYLVLIFLLLPAMLLSGLTMSPAMTSLFPFLFDLFGGRQSARTIHFVAANLVLLFVLIHVVQVLLWGAFNLTRSMITGRYVVKGERTS
jgi:thiosulfate reductase cytochrome b subunit